MSEPAAATAPALVPRLALSGITKAYPGVVANDGIDLTVLPGEIHAVLGENGAGKSTLMKIIDGVVRPDAGTMAWNGVPITMHNPARARRLGIGMVFQHFSLFETLTVAENIALAIESGKADAALAARITDVSARYGLPLDPARHVHTMSVGERQRVEIVRCLLQKPLLLILDEPTSVLTPQAVERLFDTLRMLAAEGCSILYISHKLDEIRNLCHRATVLRAGRVTGSCDPRVESPASLARMMIGSDMPRPKHRGPARAGDGSLVMRGLDLPAQDAFGIALRGITLTVGAGEIVGIAGVSGNGQHELIEAISGERSVRPAQAIVIDGIAAGMLGPGARRELGLAVVPEDRLGKGAVPELTLAENALLTAHRRGLVQHGFIRERAVRAFAADVVREFGVKATGPLQLAGSLSGGNLQKFIMGREIAQHPKVLVAAQPTWGLDVGAAAQVRQALMDMRDAGVAVLVVSEELDELFEIGDRIAVMAQGTLSAPRRTSETTTAEIGMLMSGTFAAGSAQAATTVDAR
jgi:general nucleoside transport system ATP-binding protein